MSIYQALVYLHVVCGVAALLTFWTAAMARKGSALHKAVGRGYLIAMCGIIATAAPMSAFFFFRGLTAIGIFLLYLCVITSTAMWTSWRAVQLKRAPEQFFSKRHRAVALLNLAAAAVVLVAGLWQGNALLSVFWIVGAMIAFNMLRAARKQNALAPNWWLREHYGAMLGNGVATHIAFLSIGLMPVLSKLKIPGIEVLPWLLPLAVSAIAGAYLDRRYGAKPTRRNEIATAARAP
jgi:uncharacterized membrane protein